VSAGHFKSLVAAVKAAGLAEAPKGDGPFTVFAPTDAAFAKLPAGTVESLLKPENEDKLVGILTYHVIPGKFISADIVGKTAMVQTLQGGKLTVDATNGVMVDQATVTAVYVEAPKGAIHGIDQVVLPN
jgi:uncharacterized surface protein with fasciclin (FAS1) repeats